MSGKSKRTIFRVVGALAFVIIIGVAGRVVFRPPIPRPWPQTANLLCCVLDNYDDLQGPDPQQVESAIKSQTNSLSINKTLLNLMLAKSSNFRPLAGFNLSDGVFHDGWGTPLIFAFTNNATNSGLIPSVTRRPFVVWSAGPNRTNEYGSGDDVIVTGR